MAVVLVTGGNRGIGAACVRWFLDNGDQVATTYRSADPPPVPEGADADALPRRAVRRHRRGPDRGGLLHH